MVVNDLGTDLSGSGQARSAADAVVAEIAAAGGEAVANHDSVATWEGAEAIVQTALDAFGQIDGVVNNAGFLRDRSFHKMSEDEWDAIIKVHLYGTFYVTRAAMPYFRSQSFGRIVVTTSVTGLYGFFGQANYGAAKLGVVGLINTLAVEGRDKNVFANAVSPIATTRLSAGALKEEFDPAYVSALVAYLVSEECATTGEVLHASSGRYTRVAYMESRGAEFAEVPSPDQLAEKWDELMDLDGARLGALA